MNLGPCSVELWHTVLRNSELGTLNLLRRIGGLFNKFQLFMPIETQQMGAFLGRRTGSYCAPSGAGTGVTASLSCSPVRIR